AARTVLTSPQGPTEPPRRAFPLARDHIDLVVAAGAGGVGRRLPGRLELAAAVGGPDLDGAPSLGAGRQGQPPLPPGGPGQLAAQGGRDPAGPAVQRHLDPPDAAVPR